MDKKKKIILISGIAVVAIVVIIGIICLCVGLSKKANTNADGTAISKLDKFYTTLSEKGSYSVTTTVDENNKNVYAKQDDKAYTDSIYDGVESKFIIRDGNSYLIMDDSKTCYTYQNNQTNLNKVEDEIARIKDTGYESGEEKIENKKYKYEEYAGPTSFAIMDTSEVEESEVKTRFYFDKDKLVYIKTILPDKEQLIKVEISDEVNGDLFEIPSDYEMK